LEEGSSKLRERERKEKEQKFASSNFCGIFQVRSRLLKGFSRLDPIFAVISVGFGKTDLLLHFK